MKFVFIASDFAPRTGGVAQFIYGLLSQLPPENVEVVVSPVPGWEAFDSQQAFRIHRLLVHATWAESVRNTKWMLPYFLRQLNKIPDIDMVVCCHGTLSLMFAAYLVKKRRGTPYSVFLHGLDILGVRGRPQWFFYKRLLQAADVVFPNSKMIEKAAQSGGVHPSNLNLIHPGVNVDDLQVRIPSAELRLRLGLMDKYIILTVARLTKAKGIDTIIQALPQVVKNVPHVHYVVVGDGPARTDLEMLAVEYGVQDAITFLGEQRHHEIADYFAMSDLFVMTPHENPDTINVESFGVVYLEANYLGLPVIASSAGGISVAVKHEETGLLVSPGQVTEVAEAIMRLRQDRNLAQNLAENGRQRVIDEFTCAVAARQFLSAASSHLK